MREARAINKALGEAGFPQAGVVRPEAEAFVIARDRDNSAVGHDFGHAKIVDDGVIVILTTLCRMDIACVSGGASRDFLLPINNGSTDAKCWLERGALPE